MRIVAGVHSRDVKTALFLALDAEGADIVATATTTSELISYCRSFRPDVAIVEGSLPGRQLDETLDEVAAFAGRALVIDPEGRATAHLGDHHAELFLDVAQVVDALPRVTE